MKKILIIYETNERNGVYGDINTKVG